MPLALLATVCTVVGIALLATAHLVTDLPGWLSVVPLSELGSALFTTGLANAQLAGSLRVRGEHWTWFETPGYDDEYRFLGVLLRAGVTHRFTKTLDGQVEAAVPLLAGLPDNAVAPAPRGQLGFGGSYSNRMRPGRRM